MAKQITPPAQTIDDDATTYEIVRKRIQVGMTEATEEEPARPIIERRQCIVCTLRAANGEQVRLPGQWVHDLTTGEQSALASLLAKVRAAAEAELPANEGTITEQA